MNTQSRLILITVLSALISACTGQIPGSFRYNQLDEVFNSTTAVNTKLDMLWVIDNSASMDVSQDTLRNGFASFAQKYMKPNWDIRLGVITTDTYIADPIFTNYLAMNWGGGFTVAQNFPSYGPNWATLKPGMHDGPMPSKCNSSNPYFYSSGGVAQCTIRAGQTNDPAYGISHCITPSGGQAAVHQCVNTDVNNVIHTGKSFISTQPPVGTPGDSTWVQGLINDFTVMLSVGANGNGSERGLQSIMQMLGDNEGSPYTFFRKDSLRVIIIVSDEDDQTMWVPSSLLSKTGVTQKSGITPVAGHVPGSTNYTSTCNSRSIPYTTKPGSSTYTIYSCPKQPPNFTQTLLNVSDAKDQIDQFFWQLDDTVGTGASPNYFVATITPLSGETIDDLHAQRYAEQQAIFGAGPNQIASDIAQRYIDFGNLVGNGSFAMELDTTDYSPILNAIGNVIVQKKAVFQLSRAPTGSEDMIVKVVHADGSVTIVNANQYTINGKTLTFTDQALVLSLTATDQVAINYQPKTAF